MRALRSRCNQKALHFFFLQLLPASFPIFPSSTQRVSLPPGLPSVHSPGIGISCQKKLESRVKRRGLAVDRQSASQKTEGAGVGAQMGQIAMPRPGRRMALREP